MKTKQKPNKKTPTTAFPGIPVTRNCQQKCLFKPQGRFDALLSPETASRNAFSSRKDVSMHCCHQKLPTEMPFLHTFQAASDNKEKNTKKKTRH